MNITVRTRMDRKYGHAGSTLVDPYTEERNGHLYLVSATQYGSHAILCEGIVDVAFDAEVPSTPTEPEVRYSDEWLDWAEAGHAGVGQQRTAPMLREIPVEQRQRAVGLAHSIMNRVSTNYSGAMWDALAELRSANYGETVTERQGREWREREQERRQAEWDREARAYARSQA